MTKPSRTIEAQHCTIRNLLSGNQFHIDYFQREYGWKQQHIEALINDLTAAFQEQAKQYPPNHPRELINHYQGYYIGPMVFNNTANSSSIIDGQQRITSLTLLLIYLNNKIKELKEIKFTKIESLILTKRGGRYAFNLLDKSREQCIRGLFKHSYYEPKSYDNETVHNLVERYRDIDLENKIDDEALPYFVDWLLDRVMVVKIIAHSSDRAYKVFETMNNRGLKLTDEEKLKSFVLSKITDKSTRDDLHNFWTGEVNKLRALKEKEADSIVADFFQTWFKGQYAETIANTNKQEYLKDADFIGASFYNWFKLQHKQVVGLNTEDDLYEFFKEQLPFWTARYLEIRKGQAAYDSRLPHLYYCRQLGISASLIRPTLISAICLGDAEHIIHSKFDATARAIETYFMCRIFRQEPTTQRRIKYDIFNLTKLVRGLPLDQVNGKLYEYLQAIPERFRAAVGFQLNERKNQKYTKHLLARISSYMDQPMGGNDTYPYYMATSKEGRYEIAHIWGENFTDYARQFEREEEFAAERNRIGGLLLLPKDSIESYSTAKYAAKLKGYLKENTYAQTLHPDFYKKNPGYLNNEMVKGLELRGYPTFTKDNLDDRCGLVRRICEQIWSLDYFKG